MDCRKRISSETGGGLVLVVLLLGVLTGVSALVLGNSRQQEINVQLQAVVDAAAVAGASALTGDRLGWLASKRKSLDLFRTSSVPWVAPRELQGLELSEGEGDAYEEDSILYGGSDPFSGTIGRLDNLKVTVERGLYWRSDDGSFKFISLEDANLDSTGTRRISYGVDVYVLSNAVRVIAELRNVTAFLPRFLGRNTLGVFKKEAIAAADPDSLTTCVFPVAVKVCDLMYNQSGKQPMTTADPEFASQCNRQLYATEADPDRAGDEIREGRYRAEKQHVRVSQAVDYSFGVDGEPAAVRPKLNEFALPLGATIGLPAAGSAPKSISGYDVVQALGRGCVKASVGQFLNPVESTSGFLGSSSVQKAFEHLVASHHAYEHPSFADEFCNSPDCSAEAGGKRNFPYLSRWSNPVSVGSLGWIKWPIGIADDLEPVFDTIYTGDYQPLESRNPMCSAEGLANNTEAPVAKGYVMLIAPEDDDYSYCDYDGVVQGRRRPRLDPSDHSSKPRIVGFIEAVFHDTNVMELYDEYDEQGRLNPAPLGRINIQNDRNPVAIPMPGSVFYQLEQYYMDLIDYELEHAAWRAECGGAETGERVCIACAGTPGNCNPSGVCTETCPPGASGDNICGLCKCTQTISQTCGDEPSEPPVPEDLDLATGEEWKGECFEIRACQSKTSSEHEVGQPIPFVDPFISANTESCTNMSALNPKLYAKRGKKCLPLRRRGRFALNDPASYEAPRHLRPGYGCGGLVGKLTCNPDQTPFGDVPKSMQKAGLVN